jgi:hypothetical protein
MAGLYLAAATTMEVDPDEDYDYTSYRGGAYGAHGGCYGGTGVTGAGSSSQRPAKPAAPALVNPHMNVTLAQDVVDRRLDQLFDREW